MNPFSTLICTLVLVGTIFTLSNAILVQPHNYMLDDSGILGSAHHQFYERDAADSSLLSAASLNNFRSSRSQMLSPAEMDQQDNGEPSLSHFSAEMAELIKNEQRNQANQEEPSSLTSSVAHVLMNVAQAAADHEAADQVASSQQQATNNDAIINENNNNDQQQQALMSADAGSSSSLSSSSNAKENIAKTGPLWYNPKETIPVLKISSMGKLITPTIS